MRLAWLAFVLVALSEAAVAQTVRWVRPLVAINFLNENRVAFAAPLPNGNMVIDVGRRSYRFEMSVLDASGAVEVSHTTDHAIGFDSRSVLTSSGDYVRYAITSFGSLPRGNLESIDTATGDLNWAVADQSLRYELNTDAAGNLYVLKHDEAAPNAPLQIQRYDAIGTMTPIATMATGNALVVPLDRVNGMPGWATYGPAGYQICRLGVALSCATLPIPAGDVVREIGPVPGSGALVVLLKPAAGLDLARFSDAGALLWRHPVSTTGFSWEASPRGIPLLVADDPACSGGQLGFRVLALDGEPDSATICLDGAGHDAVSTRFTDLGSQWALSLGGTSTPKIIDTQSGHAYWLRLPSVQGDTVAFSKLIPLTNSEFATVTVDWKDQSTEIINARRVELVDTLFRDTFDYFAP